MENPKQTAKKISKWIEDYAVNAGKTSLIVGVSGGIDSAVIFRLCQMTSLKVIPVFLPLNGQQEDKLLASVEELIGIESPSSEQLPSAYIEDDIDTLEIDNYLYVGEIPSKALGNYAARMRMAKLYLVAELNNGIVVGTTNAAEWLLGYFTKWGDGAVDIEPIRDLLKREVYQLGREGFDVPVPDSILYVAPSANLEDGQTDEGDFGTFSYNDVDDCIMGENFESDEEKANGIMKWVTCGEHKKCETPYFMRNDK